jgi:thiol-disulfide isomerase/thioredoxin
MNDSRLKMTNFFMGGLVSVLCGILYVTGSLISFSFADHGQSITAVLPKVAPYAMNNLGKLKPYIAVTAYNKKFSDEGHHADLIKLISTAKKGVVFILWTPTCPKCKTQLKALALLSKKYSGIKFVSVVTTFGSSLEAARKYWSKNVGFDHNMILVQDSEGKDSIFRAVFAMTNQAAVPTTVFVNKNLEVLSAVAGPIKWENHAARLMQCKFEK